MHTQVINQRWMTKISGVVTYGNTIMAGDFVALSACGK